MGLRLLRNRSWMRRRRCDPMWGVVTPEIKHWFGTQLILTCCHEAGHAVSAHRTGGTEIVIRVTATLTETPDR